ALGVHARLQRSLGCELIREPVCERIRKRHADFKDVCAAFDDGFARPQGRLEVGVSGTKVRDKTRAVFPAGASESLSNTIHEAAQEAFVRNVVQTRSTASRAHPRGASAGGLALTRPPQANDRVSKA